MLEYALYYVFLPRPLNEDAARDEDLWMWVWSRSTRIVEM
jgi:hypothetical protein